MDIEKQTAIQQIEQLSARAVPPEQTLEYDGWSLRFAAGVVRRANSINPFSPSTRDIHAKIARCERLYAQKGLDVVFRLTSLPFGRELDRILSGKQYAMGDTVSVQTLALSHVEKPRGERIRIYETFHEDWFAERCTFEQISDFSRNAKMAILKRIPARTCYLSVHADGRTAACGLGVLEGGWLGLFEIITAPELRNQGYGREALLQILHWGRTHGAEKAYLQVVTGNEAAVKLYDKIGFREQYTYWYRIKNRL